MKISHKINLIFLLLLSYFVGAQVLSTQISRTEMAVGETAVLQLNIDGIKLSDKIEIAPKNKLLPTPHFETISDTSSQQEFKFGRSVEFAIYEEGQFTLPSLQVKVNGKVLQSVPYIIKVNNPAQPNAKALNDIMDVKRLPLSWQDYWEMYKFYFLAFLILIALIFMGIGFWKYARKQKSEAQKPTNKYQKSLDLLKAKPYIENNESRIFYVELIEIARAFLAEQYQMPAIELLTDDLLQLINKNPKFSQESSQIIQEVFERGDLAKFAKLNVNQELMQKDFASIQKLIALPVLDLETENYRKHV